MFFLLTCVVSSATNCSVLAADPVDPVAGTDRIVIQPAGKTGRISQTGSIEDYTGRGLILKTRAGSSRYGRDEVIEVTTGYLDKHVAGRKLFAAGKVAEADAAFQDALDDEHRTWVRREILASQVKCSLWQGNYLRAAQRFLPIVESDPDTLYFGLMPLVWQEQPPASASTSEARRWLLSHSAASQLLAASWLYHVDRAAAVKVFQSLSSASQPTIQRFAQMQLWRARLDAGDVSAPELRRWVTLVEELPPDLRAGPMFLVARGYEQQHDGLNAAAAWLWLPFEFSEHRHLAAEAQFRAADALLRAGDAPAAGQQTQELLLRYGDTPAAVRAKELQQRLEAQG